MQKSVPVFGVTSFNYAALDAQSQCVQRATRLSAAISTRVTIQRSTETFYNGISVLASSKAEVQCMAYMDSHPFTCCLIKYFSRELPL